MDLRRRWPGIVWVTVLVISVTTISFIRPHLDKPRLSREARAQPIYLPQAKYLHLLSLQYDNVLADILWFRTINYFGEHYEDDRTYSWLAYMCDLVTDLDPRAEHVYRFAGMILPWEANQADAGIRLLRKGIEENPESWLLYYWLGFNLYFFKSDYAGAARYMLEASKLPNAHANTARFAAVLAVEQYGPETTLGLLAEMADEVSSKEMRGVLQEHMREARFAADMDRLDVAINHFRQRGGGPPSDLSELVDAQLIAAVPPDPFGGRYVIDGDTGAVRSSTGRTPSQLHQSTLRRKALEGDSVRDF